ncbi:head GIN domain-containing protein [Flagellimonas zhangzhouensis]|uniref:Putative auto-transporter adhesin, head GIN domain n=1 Tax=Flagellimonas zhangzhouensis TaxID=1073328 RepID=A0A1H2X7W0_9FLAO|nr:head GIN domain-containing protein [Allomuricauda zhangzhouensis]SDQ29131.1 Putative auto-transporter adhesin, head GIN domain [Allomuricauda zhangzhouensis]SDW88877.1 Putative auto-transporter adhesin, head GIN domain [Allomuricauda zhangzhouensis]
MKKICTLSLILLPLIMFSQRIIDTEVGEFNEIKVFDLIEVNLIQSDENRIMIKGWNVDDIKWTNKNGVLKLRMQLDKKFQGEDTMIEVYYTNLDVIDGNEGAEITCNELVQKSKIELRAQEGATIHIGMDVDYADIRAVTGGIIEASGLAKNQSVVLNTGGVFEGRELRTSNTDIKISAGGEADVFASEMVDINVKAGGDVYVYGQPKTVHKKTFVGGRIYIKD